MKRKNIFLIAFISAICIIAGYMLWGLHEDAGSLKQKHVVLIGNKIAHTTDENGELSFLNDPAYCVWYVHSNDSEIGTSNKHAIAVDNITDKEKVINGINALTKQGLKLDKIAYMLVLAHTRDAFTLQKDIHKEFKVKAGYAQSTMEAILEKYQPESTDGRNEVHLVLKNGEKQVAKAMTYTTTCIQDSDALYESYIELNNKDSVPTLIDSAMRFAKDKQYANGGLTVYFNAKNEIKGVQPCSRLFPKLSYRNIFESYKPSQQEGYQAYLYYTPNDTSTKGRVQLHNQIEEKYKSSLKSIRTKSAQGIIRNIPLPLNNNPKIPVDAEVGLHLQNESQDELKNIIEGITAHPPISAFIIN